MKKQEFKDFVNNKVKQTFGKYYRHLFISKEDFSVCHACKENYSLANYKDLYDKIMKEDYSEIIEKVKRDLFSFFQCCFYREGSVIDITPNGDIKTLIPCYGNEDLYCGNVKDDFEYIKNKMYNLKNMNFWEKDETCIKCNMLPKCFGSCVKASCDSGLKPSEVCNKDFMEFYKKCLLKRYLQETEFEEPNV